eukprot:12839918-Alexandrium_andersonii.AAC.1
MSMTQLLCLHQLSDRDASRPRNRSHPTWTSAWRWHQLQQPPGDEWGEAGGKDRHGLGVGVYANKKASAALA